MARDRYPAVRFEQADAEALNAWLRDRRFVAMAERLTWL